MKKVFLPVAILLVLIMLVTGCATTTKTTTPVTTPTASPATTSTVIIPNPTVTSSTPTATSTASAIKTGGTLRILYGYSPATKPGYPADTTNTQVIWTESAIFEALIKQDANGKPVPWLATDWAWGANNTYIDFNLRNDVKFHDGTKFTADSVVTDINQLFTDKYSVTVNWDRIEKTGDYSVRLYLKKYMRDFWGGIGGVFYVSDTMLKENGLQYVKDHPTGTGPFLFKSWEKDVALKFVKNPDYWQPGKPYLDEIDLITVKQSLTAQAKMENDEGDLLVLQTGKIVHDLQNDGFSTISMTGSANFIMFDTKNDGQPTNNPLVRQAIEYAINKQEIADALGYGGMKPSNQIAFLGNPANDPNIGTRDYSPTKAKALLTQAGYTNGLTLHLIVQTADSDLAVMLQQYMKAVNITLELELVDNSKFWNYLLTGWKGIIATGFAAGTNWPNFLRTYFPPVGVFDVSVKIPDDIVAKCNAAMVETSDAKFQADSYELSQWTFDNAFFVPTVGVAMAYIFKPSVQGGGFLTKYATYYIWDPETCWIDTSVK